MNKIILSIIALLCCVSVFYPQQNKSNSGKKKVYISDKRKIVPTSSEKSVVRNFDLEDIAIIKDGDIFIGGRNTALTNENGQEKNRGYGVLLKISNGEMTVKKLPFLSDVRYLSFLDNSVGWIAGYNGTYKTSDGGKTWRKVVKINEIPYKMFFVDNDKGWYFGNDLYLHSITNEDTEKLEYFGDSYIKKLQFTTSENGWLMHVVNYKSRFSHTEDGGKTWNDVNGIGEGINDFQFINDYDGFAITSEGLYKTNDGGKVWTLNKKQTKNQWYDRIFFIDQNNGLLIGVESICSTTDGAVSWECKSQPKQMKLALRNIREVAFTGVNNGLLIANGELYATKDGGISWKMLNWRDKLDMGD